jgi:hypothetical protein
MDVVVVRNVVAVVLQRGGIERQQPERRHAEVLQIVELACESLKVTDAIAVAVSEGAHVQLVKHRLLVPERVLHHRRLARGFLNLNHAPPCQISKFEI